MELTQKNNRHSKATDTVMQRITQSESTRLINRTCCQQNIPCTHEAAIPTTSLNSTPCNEQLFF